MASNNVTECSSHFFSFLQFQGKKYVLDWCMQIGLIASERVCEKCGERMSLCETNKNSDGYRWRCQKSGVNAHDVCYSVRKGSWFSLSRLTIPEILRITWYWFGKCSNEFVMLDVKVSKPTVVDWFMFCREVCMVALIRECRPIGGPGVVVEIDESKFGKMKYGRGRHVCGKWVFGGVERESNKCFFRVVEERTKETLLKVLRECVLPGTTIISDCWKSYDCLQDEGFVHYKVNHSVNFVDVHTGAHTNTIEATWSAIKRALRNNTNYVRGHFDSYLAAYMWRKLHGQKLSDAVFLQFLADVRTTYDPYGS